MAINFNFKDEGYAIPYDALSWTPLRRRIDVPALIANQSHGQELVDDDGLVVALPSTGFAATNILRVFKVPAGTIVRLAGLNVLTVEGGVATVDIGDGDDDDGYIAAGDLNALGATITTVALGYGADNVMGKFYAANDSIDILWNTADTAVTVFDVFAEAMLLNPAE